MQRHSTIARPTSIMMASTGMRADDLPTMSKAAKPEVDTSNNELCGLCLRALTIDDQRAGGAIRVNTSDGTTALDLSGFTQNNYEPIAPYDGVRGNRRSRSYELCEERDPSGWRLRGSSYRHNYDYGGPCTGDGHERVVTVPKMLEISPSAVGTCTLCSKLKQLFQEQYEGCSWWEELGSTLRFIIQYEWTAFSSTLDGGEDGTKILSFTQKLDGLAVLVSHLGKKSDEVDVYTFDVVAWPGISHKFLS